MAILSCDSTVSSGVLPSIWKGYMLPRSVIMGEKLPYQGMVFAKDVPQEWLDEMMNVFQNGSVAEFYDKYLGNIFAIQDHEQILVKADEILKTDVQKWHLPEDPLVAVAATDIAHNADEYGHHLFQTACFLKEQGQLPKECRSVLWRKINPALYEEKEQFDQVVKCLAEPAQKIPHQWTQAAFYKWIHTDDSKAYLSQMEKMAVLEHVLANKGQLLIEFAVKNYKQEHQTSPRRHRLRSRPRRIGWRPYGE